jgi:hypothetical protein
MSWRALLGSSLGALTCLWLIGLLGAQDAPRYVPRENPGRGEAAAAEPRDEVKTYTIFDERVLDFHPSGWMPDGKGIAQSTSYKVKPHSGKVCYQGRYKLDANPWVGVSFLLDGKWENHSRKVDLFRELGARKGDPIVLRFWARSPDGATAKFGVGSDKDSLVFPVETDWLRLGPNLNGESSI